MIFLLSICKYSPAFQCSDPSVLIFKADENNFSIKTANTDVLLGVYCSLLRVIFPRKDIDSWHPWAVCFGPWMSNWFELHRLGVEPVSLTALTIDLSKCILRFCSENWCFCMVKLVLKGQQNFLDFFYSISYGNNFHPVYSVRLSASPSWFY